MGLVLAEKGSEPLNGTFYVGSTIWKDVVANVATTVDKLVPWFAGWASPWSLLAEATSIASARAPMAESGVESADGLLFYASTVPGSHRAGPCDPGGAPYGRTEVGRSRRHRTQIPPAWERG